MNNQNSKGISSSSRTREHDFASISLPKKLCSAEVLYGLMEISYFYPFSFEVLFKN